MIEYSAEEFSVSISVDEYIRRFRNGNLLYAIL